jgi:hypothetical protein
MAQDYSAFSRSLCGSAKKEFLAGQRPIYGHPGGQWK